MRVLLLSFILLGATASCTEQAASQVAPPFDRAAAIERVRESDFRTSLGVLLTEPQPHSVAIVRERLDAALETRFSTQTDSAESFVMGDGHFHIANIGGTLVRINSFDTPYFAPEDEFSDPELKDAVARHTAWIAIDVEAREGGPNEAGAYRLAGRILQSFADKNAVVVFSASARSIAPWGEEFRDLLRGPNPRSVFGELEGEIVSVTADDPEMEAAVAEAKRRFPEFRGAFARRGRGQSLFLVKAPFDYADGVEHMWVEVNALTETGVEGLLANDPYYVETLKAGDTVTVTETQISDWVYRTGREPVGGFTMAVLARRMAEEEATEATEGESTAQPATQP